MQLVSRLRQMVTRGRITQATLNPKRVLVQLDALNGETKSKIEVVSPYGFSFFPPKGADVVLLQVGGSRAHLVAICADDPALRIADLQEGEFGFRDRNGQQIVFRTDRIEITAPDGKNIVVNGGNDLNLTVQGDLNATVSGQTVVNCDDIQLGGAGGKKVVLDGDTVSAGVVHASSTKVRAT